ncbi:MAG TPA: PsbP-related protein [Candidatus Saccharimonadales bacterium]|nr:PsbP-related protein [Candidatus Saccharimonadales bacterium]
MKINERAGFTVVEGLLLVVIVGILGFTGWFVLQSKKNVDKTNAQAAANSQSSSQSSVQVYKKTTTVPANWKTYSDSTYKFSFSYPSAWFFSKVSGGSMTGGKDPLAEFDVKSLGGKALGADGISIVVFKQSLMKTLENERISDKNANSQTANSGKEMKYTTTALTIDGNNAIKYDFPSPHAALKTVYLIYHNGYTYDVYLFSPNGDNTNPLSKNTLTSFESLKFN